MDWLDYLSIYIGTWFLIHSFNSTLNLNLHVEFLPSSVASTTEYLAYVLNFKCRISELNAVIFFNSMNFQSQQKRMKVVFSLETPNEESAVFKLLVAA